jgi:hypothetical protein
MAELAQLSRKRQLLMDRHLVPLAEDLLSIAEREAELWEQLAETNPAWSAGG